MYSIFHNFQVNFTTNSYFNRFFKQTSIEQDRAKFIIKFFMIIKIFNRKNLTLNDEIVIQNFCISSPTNKMNIQVHIPQKVFIVMC